MGRMIKRGAVIIGVALAALVGLLAGAIAVDGLGGAGRLQAVANTVIPGAGGPDVRAYVARPAGTGPRPAGTGPRPAVIMIHEFWGLNADIAAKADLLAQEGYLVVAPDMFRGSTTGFIPRAIYQVISTPAAQINADVDAVFNWLAAQPEVQADRIAIMGFCFGGRTSLLYSLEQPQLAATVVLYGQVTGDADALRALSGPVLGIFGGADTSIPLDEVRAFEAGLEAAGVPHQVSVYDGQPHAFVSSVAGIQAGGAQGQAWAEVTAFLKQALQGDGAGARPVRPGTPVALDDWGYWLSLAYEHAFGAGAHPH